MLHQPMRPMPDWFYQPIARPLLFRLPAERARSLALGFMGRLARLPLGPAVIEFLGHMRPDPRLARNRNGHRVPDASGTWAGPGSARSRTSGHGPARIWHPRRRLHFTATDHGCTTGSPYARQRHDLDWRPPPILGSRPCTLGCCSTGPAHPGPARRRPGLAGAQRGLQATRKPRLQKRKSGENP